MEAMTTTSNISSQDRWDHALARLGWRRMDHLVNPGLYILGRPTPESPVLVSANYRLSFDVLRRSLRNSDCYILVLDTKGVNVWCAAGKKTFGTDELVHQIEATDLGTIVSHRRVIVPQLGAPGVSAHEVKQRSGFLVEYGPVRAEDLPAYLRTHQATAEMRRVSFPLKDRAVLVPVELVYVLPYMLGAAFLLFLAGGAIPAMAVMGAALAGTVLFPLLLPALPTKEFTSKGLVLGLAVAIPFSAYYGTNAGSAVPMLLGLLVPPLLMAPWTAFLALNFTGCSTYTSRTGVRKEIFRWIPVLAVMAVAGTILAAIAAAGRWMGWF